MFSCTPADESAEPIPHVGCGCCTPQVRSIARRIDRELTRRGFIAGVGASLAALGFAPRARAQAAEAARPVVFSNFLLFDGKSSALKGGLRLLVEAGRIKTLATDDFSPPDGAQAIDCGGRTLMPGLIDAHWHTIFAGLPISALLTADVGFIMLAASAEAERTLMRGFTTVRDLGGPAFGLKQAIDDGLAIGPRIYPSGAMITSSGGHGDLRPLSDLPRDAGGAPSAIERTGAASIADGADQVRLRAREQLLQGASQVKLTASGGVSSPRTTLDMVTFSEPELRAGVETAADRQTYVAVHAYPSVAIERAIAAGVAVHRARSSHGRGDGPAHGRKGRLAQHPAVPQRGGHRSARRPESRERASGLRRARTPSMRSPKSTRSRPRSARICCSLEASPSGRA